MNKPKFEARGKKHNRGQGTTPDQELKDVLSENAPPISEGLGISPEALNTEGFSTAEVAERHYGFATPEHQTNMGVTATAPFVGMDREWTAEEKAGMNDSLRKYGWKDGAEPVVGQEHAVFVPDTAGTVSEAIASDAKAIVNAAPGYKLGGAPFVPLGESADRYQGPPEDGYADLPSSEVPAIGVEAGKPVEDTPGTVVAAVMPPRTGGRLAQAILGADHDFSKQTKVELDLNYGGAPGYVPPGMIPENEEVLRLLDEAHRTIVHTPPADMRTFMRELLFKLEGVPVTGKPGEFDESWVSNQSYVPKNLILFVIRTPKVPIPGIPSDMLKRVLEMHPISITGLKRSFKTRDRDLTRTQQRFEAVPSVVRMEFGEKYGRAIGKMFEAMARRVCAVAVNDNTTVDFMLVEPDTTHNFVLDAWLCTDMWPSEVENIDGVRDITSSKDPAHVDVTWSGHVDRSDKIDEQAQALLAEFIVASANPYDGAAFVNSVAESLTP